MSATNLSPAVAGRDMRVEAVPRLPHEVWLYKPAVDLIIGCAAWTVPLLLVAYLFSGSSSALSIVFYGLALFLNYPHYTATIYRAYRTREDFSRYRIFTLHLTILMVLTGAVAHWAGWLMPWIFTIYITWSPWHYSGQNFGLAMMFARRAGIKPSRKERGALYTAFAASYGVVFLTMHTGTSNDPYVLSIGLPGWLGTGLRTVLVLVFAVTGPWALYQLAKRGGWRLIVAPVTLFSTQFLWFVFPFFLQVIYGIEVPQTRYSTGILAVMHSAQYLWITSYYARREAIASGETFRARSYFTCLIIGGIALFLPGPWLISYVLHYDFTSSFLIFTAIVNIHHFLLDGALWKLREGRIASLLISAPEKVTSSLWGMAGWVASGATSARVFRISATLLLVLLAGLDQARFIMGSDGGKTSWLSRAERLNPYDSSLHDTLGRAEQDVGEIAPALGDFHRAVHLNPYNPEVRQAYFKLLVKHERYQEAYDEYGSLSRYIQGDADSLLNLGTLAQKFGHQDEAINSWKKALALQPDSRVGHFDLANALYDSGRREESIPYYEEYLGLMTQHVDLQSDPSEVVAVTLRLGDAYAATKDYQRALVFCERATSFAHRAGQKSLESLALEHEGNLYAAVGQRADAARFYMAAIQLDYEGKDDRAAGLDWFGYAQFLSDSGQPKNLVLACALKAESVLAAFPGKDLDTVNQYVEDLEKALGSEAAQKVHDNQDQILEQAVSPRL